MPLNNKEKKYQQKNNTEKYRTVLVYVKSPRIVPESASTGMEHVFAVW